MPVRAIARWRGGWLPRIVSRETMVETP